MKYVTPFLAALLLTATTSFAPQPDNSCDAYFATKAGTSWEQTMYDAKNKVSSITVGKVTAFEEIDGGFSSTMNIEVLDDKRKSLSQGDVTMKCQNDKFYMDMSNMFPKDMAEIEGAEIEMENPEMEFPTHPVAGQTLPDQTSTMTVKLNGMNMMTMTIKTTNRKIEGFESVTTPAGTFECMKYSSDSEVKSMFTSKSRTIMWMAKNVGTVKMETYNDKGKLEGTQLLTKFSD